MGSNESERGSGVEVAAEEASGSAARKDRVEKEVVRVLRKLEEELDATSEDVRDGEGVGGVGVKLPTLLNERMNILSIREAS